MIRHWQAHSLSLVKGLAHAGVTDSLMARSLRGSMLYSEDPLSFPFKGWKLVKLLGFPFIHCSYHRKL